MIILADHLRGVEPPSLPETVRNILVIRLDGLGDLIMTTPVFEELKRRYPEARITALVQPVGAALLNSNPWVDLILHPPSVKGRVLPRFRRECAMVLLYLRRLQHETYDLVLHPRLGPDYYAAGVLTAFMSRSAYAVKYEEIADNRINMHVESLASAAVRRLRRPGIQHEVHSNLELVEQITGARAVARPRIFLTRDDRDEAGRILTPRQPGSRLLAVSFGAQAERRRWPVDRWAETLEMLAEEHRLHILILCAAGDRAEGEHLQSRLAIRQRLGDSVESYRGQGRNSSPHTSLHSSLVCGSPLRVAAACLEQADLFLGTDSGLAHLAAAVGCATVVVSPHPADGDLAHENSPQRFRPWTSTPASTRVVQPLKGLAPCSSGCDAIEPHCILQISALEVVLACSAMLSAMERREQSPAASLPLAAAMAARAPLERATVATSSLKDVPR